MDQTDSDEDEYTAEVPTTGSDVVMNDFIKKGIGTVMKELYGYLFVPFLIIVLFLIFHIFELYSLIKLINNGLPVT